MTDNFSWELPYASRRSPVLARNVVATSQPLAAQAGLQMLAKGGNAVDAGLATAIALTVLEPSSNGIGGDAFAIVWDGTRLHGFNGSGRAPRALTLERLKDHTEMPEHGWEPVTVPGCVDAWTQLSDRFGRLPCSDLFEPAIRYARDGFIVSPNIAARWAEAVDLHADRPDFQRAFAPNGSPPRAGECFRFPEQADTLGAIADSAGESFYRGDIAERLVAYAKQTGGFLANDDLAMHQGAWVDCIGHAYRNVHVHELPPNGQGLGTLIALGILAHHDLATYPVDSADSIHLQIEAMKIAFVEAQQHIADPDYMQIDIERFLAADYLAERASQIRMDRAAQHPTANLQADQGTVYLCAADDAGTMVSFIQSNYHGFGSGVVVPGTGVSLQNRGAGFSLQAGHPNCIAGGKRPFHTIMPGFITADGEALMSFGVMGAHMQPQGHVQMVTRIFDYGQNPQAAADAPRWFVAPDFKIALEPGSQNVRDELVQRGHVCMDDTEVTTSLFGGAQLIYRLPDGYCAASEQRKDGQAVGY